MRNLKDLTQEEILGVMEKYLFEQNDEQTRRNIKTDIEKLLNNKIHLEDDTTPHEVDKGWVSVVSEDGNRLTISGSEATYLKSKYKNQRTKSSQTNITSMNILDEANKIVNERSEEKERAYGSFSEGMKRAASIASGMTGKNITADDMFQCMVALKFSRQSFNHKTDNLLDAVAYIGAWNNFIDEKDKPEDKSGYHKVFDDGESFKKKLEDEVFPPTETKITAESAITDITEIILETNKKLDLLTKYVEYLAQKTDQTITYAEYVGEHTSNVKDDIEDLKKKMEAVTTLIRSYRDVGDAGPK
jgi:hypothetical protein